MKSIILFSCMLLVFSTSEVIGRRFDKCGMARELLRLGFSRNQLVDWVCLIESESSYDTSARGPVNTDGSYDWGLFQINDRYWCQGNYPSSSNICRVNCADLLSNDIGASVACAKMVYQEQGFSAWAGWRNKCQNGQFSLDDCNLDCGRSSEF